LKLLYLSREVRASFHEPCCFVLYYTPRSNCIPNQYLLAVLPSHGKRSNQYKSISRFHNIKQRRLELPGLCSLHKDVENWKIIQEEIQCIIFEGLLGINHCHPDQQIEFYLSFLVSTKNSPQDPHIDYKWKDVLPTSDSKYNSETYCWSVPFIGLFPTTPEGMQVDVWPHQDHRQHATSFINPAHPVNWTIPYGHMLLMRGDTVHAGGYLTSDDGNPRCHIYVHKTCSDRRRRHLRGVSYDPQSSNIYRVSDENSDPLFKFYKRHTGYNSTGFSGIADPK
jgi:hypothetical protein